MSDPPPHDSPFAPRRAPAPEGSGSAPGRGAAPESGPPPGSGAGPPPPTTRPPGARRYGWFVGIVVLLVLAYITINTLRTEGPGSAGVEAGRQLPPFAAPLAQSDLVGDANVATGSDQGDAGPEPACDVDDPRALNICALADRGPVVLAFVTTGATKCERELDALDRLRSRFPQVGFAAVGIRSDREDLRALVRERGWGFPVAQDRDGAVANLYGVAVCPTLVLAYRGGEVMETVLGEEAGRGLAANVRALEAGPGARAR